MPLWSAAVEPRVISARALPAADGGPRTLDPASLRARVVAAEGVEHLAVERRGGIVRLDVVEGTTCKGPVTVRFLLDDDARLAAQLATLATWRGRTPAGGRYSRLSQRLVALHAVDARNAGASLRETADLLLGAGDWPGDGEHRKSRVRRLLATGQELIGAGPEAILTA